MDANRLLRLTLISAFLLALALSGQALAADQVTPANSVVKASGVKGGLCVLLGAGDGSLAVTLGMENKFAVHVLDQDDTVVARARQIIQAKNLYGPVAATQSSLTRLPYTDNLVNLVVAERIEPLLAGGLNLSEVYRVLAPRGVCLLKGELNDDLKSKLDNANFSQVEIIDGWVKACKVRPPGMDEWTHFRYSPEGNMISQDQLVGPPKRLQWIDTPPWVSHYMGLETLVSANGRLFYVTYYPTWALVARDAFNGKVLWEKPLPKYVKNNMCRADATGLLVAVNDRVFAVLEYPGPACELNAETGEVLKVFTAGGRAESILFCAGNLILADNGGVRSVDAANGQLNWQRIGGGRQIVASDGKVILLSDKRLSAIGQTDGKDLWSVNPRQQGGGGSTLQFCKNGVVVLADGYMGKNVYGFSVKDGKYLWTAPCIAGKHGDMNVFFADGLIWTAMQEDKGWAGIDPLTGREIKKMPYPGGVSGGRRCYPFKGAGHYFVMANLQMFDRRDGNLITPKLARGSCGSGSLPANGLLYSFPQGCRCTNWLRGFSAFAPSEKSTGPREEGSVVLIKGPAFGSGSGSASDSVTVDDWPTFRHDVQRSAATPTKVPDELKVLWSQEVGGDLTGPTVADGRVFIACRGQHRVIALAMADGKLLWSFTAGGRVDTPPTLFEGLCIFGSDDGWVYALNGKDGNLAWRLRAAPEERLILSCGQVASTWPVHGSVLVHNGTAYFAAGQHSELQDGIFVIAANPKSGEVKWSQNIQGLEGQGAINDLMLVDGERIYMNERWFDAATGHQERGRARLNSGEGGRNSLIYGGAQWDTGLSEDFYKRTVWHYGNHPIGQALVFQDGKVYGLTIKPIRGKNNSDQYTAFCSTGSKETLWSAALDVRANSLILAGEKLIIAGKLDENEDKRGLLIAIAAADGKELGRFEIDEPPVPDGLAASAGRLLLCTQNGRLICLGKE